MTDTQIINEINEILNSLCPELYMDVIGDRSRPTVFLSIGHFTHTFPIDRIEWINNHTDVAKINLVKHRLLESLSSLRDLFDKNIERIKQV